MYTVEGGWWLLWMGNAFLILGSASLLLGYIIGVENARFERPLNLLHYLVFLGPLVYSCRRDLDPAQPLIGNILLPYGPVRPSLVAVLIRDPFLIGLTSSLSV